MSILDKFLGRDKRENVNGMPDMHEVTLNKIFRSADLVPVEYKHTAKYYADGLDPLEYERQRLEGMPADWLMKDKRVPAIKADSRREIEIGKRQYINHTYTIQTIMDLQRGELVHAQENVARIDDEIAGYDAKIEKLKTLIGE